MKQVPLSQVSYPMLRLTIDSILEHWTELTGDDIYKVDDHRVKECAEYLSDLLAELARRI
jgi:hypothetical protein